MNQITLLLFVLITYPSLAITPTEALKPTALVAVHKGSDLYNDVCRAAANNLCQTGASLWRVSDSATTFYLTSASLKLVKVERSDQHYITKTTWDFSRESNNAGNPDSGLNRDEVYIYPALYPLNRSTQAVAIVTKWSTAYSGGGRQEEYADFMLINRDGSYQIAFKNVPFSSSEIIRACFTEADYAKESHCHDESWHTLRLEFIDEGNMFYTWKFIDKVYNWPAFAQRSATSVKVSTSTAYPFRLMSQAAK